MPAGAGPMTGRNAIRHGRTRTTQVRGGLAVLLGEHRQRAQLAHGRVRLGSTLGSRDVPSTRGRRHAATGPTELSNAYQDGLPSPGTVA